MELKKILTMKLMVSIKTIKMNQGGFYDEKKIFGRSNERGNDAFRSNGTGSFAESETVDYSDQQTYPIVDEPLTLKIMLAIRDNDSLIDPSDMPVVQALEEKTGINLEWDVVKEMIGQLS